MNDTLMLDVSQAHELKMGFRRHDWTNTLIKQLSEGENLGMVREFLLGRAEFKRIEHIVDLDADPFVPNGWAVEEHRKGGQWKWNPTSLVLYLSKKQQGGKVICGTNLRKELAKKRVLNANLLDYLIKSENQYLIPESWKKDENENTRYIFFWGTIYRGSSGSLYVRDLFWYGGGWVSSYRWLGDDWDGDDPALSLAS
ncbi:MAG: hypothetical protein WCJ74_02115 [bacterium]